MDANSSSSLTRGTLLISSALALVSGGSLHAAPASEADALPNFESYIKVSGYAPSIKGNDAAFAKRVQVPSDGAAGIEDLHLGRDLSKTTFLTVDGRAMAGSEDYLAKMKIERYDTASVEVGYKRFRTFYDGIGGFFPLNQRWYALNPEELTTDRGTFFASVKLFLPDKPQIEFKYTNELRSGQKDSLVWGDSNLTGLPTVPANNATRKITPAYIDLNDRRQAFEFSVQHTFGKTTAHLRIAREQVRNVDTRFMTRFLGEVTPNPERRSYQRDGLETQSFSVVGTTATELTEKITVHAGASYQHLHGWVSGDRPNAIGVIATYDFKNLFGRTWADIYTANVAVTYKPTKDWQIQPALRGEDSYIKAKGGFTRVTASGTNLVNANFRTNSRVKDKILTPELSARYTGVKRWVFYTTASHRLTDGDTRHTDQYSTALPTAAQLQSDTIDQDQARYVAGANWNHSSFLTLRTEVFHKDHENKFIGYGTQVGSQYVIGYKFTGLKLTAIVKPLASLSFTTRYQPQQGDMTVMTDSTLTFDSMKAKAHLISETIDWNPTAQTYVQLNANVGFNTIRTDYPYNQTPGTVTRQRNADNNFWSGSALAGHSLDKLTDVQVIGTYQKADNFDAAIARTSQPYGAAFEEYTVAVALKRKLTDHMVGHAKVGYIKSESEATGGRTNFDGPLAYVSIDFAL